MPRLLKLSVVFLVLAAVALGCGEDAEDANPPAEEVANPPGEDGDDEGEDEPGTEEPGTEEPGDEEPGDEEPGDDGAGDDGAGNDEAGNDEAGNDTEAADASHEPADPADVDANELGEVPVLMYHGIVEDPVDEWQITPDEFRAELEYLHEHDYYPIPTVDLARGEIDVPAGTTPVVLTFDDTLPTQFDYTDDGEVDPDTAVGIMLEFSEENPDFPVAGSFYVTDNRFERVDEGQEMFAHLHELGFEVGNHTIGHANLGAVDPEEAERQLALGAEQIREVVPEEDVATLSLPLGVWPEPRDVAYSGSYDGMSYEHEGILLVGSNPSPSPFAEDFDPLAIPRIRSTPSWDGEEPDYASGFWLDWLDGGEHRRYVSDGDPETVSFPADLEVEIDPEHEDRANPYE